ncbi:MAG TPA: hypothetical protein VHZ24_19520 [Pirellulales bacterium]|jgi:CheY-like chemotaxis protein|nr:hypothetical protein [Pirellulales bacterium]
MSKPATVASTALPFPPRVLVVDNEKSIRTTLPVGLETMGCEVNAVASREAAVAASARRSRHPRASSGRRL